MAQNEKTKHSFTISEETSELLLQLRTVNQLFDCTFESIRMRVPTSKVDEDGTMGADEIFSKYCFESGEHVLTLRLNNPHPDYELYASEMVVYDKE